MQHIEKWEEVLRLGRRAAGTLPYWWARMPLATQLRALREHRGVSQRQLADESGLRQSVVSRIENGSDARWSTWQTLYLGLGYRPILLPMEYCDETQELMDAERARRIDRRLRGLESGR